MGVVSDAAVIGPLVGGVIVVARVNATTRDGLRGALRQFRTVGARVIGMVVNGVVPRGRRYGGYGYGAYTYGSTTYYGEQDDAPAANDARRDAAE